VHETPHHFLNCATSYRASVQAIMQAWSWTLKTKPPSLPPFLFFFRNVVLFTFSSTTLQVRQVVLCLETL
jgi:hypothetical protein